MRGTKCPHLVEWVRSLMRRSSILSFINFVRSLILYCYHHRSLFYCPSYLTAWFAQHIRSFRVPSRPHLSYHCTTRVIHPAFRAQRSRLPRMSQCFFLPYAVLGIIVETAVL